METTTHGRLLMKYEPINWPRIEEADKDLKKLLKKLKRDLYKSEVRRKQREAKEQSEGG